MSEEMSYQLADGRELRCTTTLRLLPGKREACLGTLDETPVFAKLFLDPQRGRRHWQRELDGIKALQRHGILTAELLYAGVVGDDIPLILLAQLPDPVTLKSAWDEATPAAAQQLLEDMTAILAQHHGAGICQTDLHLDNFVISEGQIYSLDGAGIKVVSGELDREPSLDNLALFLAQLPIEWDVLIAELLPLYAVTRGWHSAISVEEMHRRVEQARQRRWRKFKNKIYRDCTTFLCNRSTGRVEIVARRYMEPELELLLQDLDSSLQDELLLKRGNSSTVWRADIGGLPLVVKRYNVKGFWHGVKLGLRPSRAFRSWRSAHRLLFYGIPTPRPIAVLKTGRRGLSPTAYFVMERVAGIGAHSWFLDAAITIEEKRTMAARVVHLLQQLQRQRISHGDLKASNILIVDESVMLIDLDSMRRHGTEIGFKRAWKSDLRRFMDNWQGAPEVTELFRQALITVRTGS